jgi:dipeptidyl aminopeptidase/acylaminoacyl peptidase
MNSAHFLGVATFTAHALLATLALYLGASLWVALRFTRGRRCRAAAMAAACPVSFAARDGRARIDAAYLGARPGAPALVFVHGKDACRGAELVVSTAGLVRSLHAAGFAVLMIDLRGHGGSSQARLTYGVRESQDVLGAVDWLRARGHGRIGVLGASMGAAASLVAAAQEPAIAAVVADSAFADLGDVLRRNYRRKTRLPAATFALSARLAYWLTGVDLNRFRPLDAAGALASRPVLLIHGEGDRLVPCEHAHRLAGAIGAALWTTPSLGHLSSYASQPEGYTARVHAFFGRALGVEEDARALSPVFSAAAA